jgi:lipopolysaccharide export system protein LptA
MKRLLRILAIVLAVAAPAAAAGPVEVSADKFVIEESSSSATFTGNVVVTRADLELRAETVVVHYGDGGVTDITDLVATGAVRLKTRSETATGERASFDPRRQILRLTGNVVLTNASGRLSGPELVVNLVEQTSVFSSSGSGRVTGVFTPQ